MAIGHADGAGVIALSKQQFQRHAPVFLEAFAVGLHVHALADFRRAGGKQLGDAGDFHEAQPAGAQVINAIEMAECGNFDAGVGGDIQDRRAFLALTCFPSMVRVFAAIKI